MLEFVDSGLYFVQDENNFFKSIVTGRIRILIPAFDPILDAIFSIIFFSLFYFFFISISGRIRIRSIFPAEADPDPWKKMSDPHPCMLYHVRKPFSLVVYRTPLAV